MVLAYWHITLSSKYPQRKNSKRVKSHDRGGQLTLPRRDRKRPFHFFLQKSIVSFAVWQVAQFLATISPISFCDSKQQSR